MRKRIATIAAAAAVVSTVLIGGSATGLEQSGQDGYAGNSATLAIVYTQFSGSCNEGRTGYRMDSAKVKFQRADSQFTARGNVGQMVASSINCAFNGNQPLNKYLNMPSSFANNTYYSTDSPSSQIFVNYAANPANQFGAYAKVNVYRGSSKVATLCAKSYLWSPTGEPCA